MDLLITVIGNAVADSVFREKLLKEPVKTLDDWGFRLTKREVGLLEEIFAELTDEGIHDLADRFDCLGKALYRNIDGAMARKVAPICPQKNCPMSVYPRLANLRDDLRKVAIEESKKAA
ncbi:MAG: hypothetical protein HY010_14720 [Acidobacteria bacterium]|nr:hypothetical protein [Acidobacteriota bacterium]